MGELLKAAKVVVLFATCLITSVLSSSTSISTSESLLRSPDGCSNLAFGPKFSAYFYSFFRSIIILLLALAEAKLGLLFLRTPLKF